MAEEIRRPKDEATADEVSQARAVTHVVPARVLVSVWLGLMVLTVITVAVATADSLDFGGKTNLWIAMIIATLKASLVLLYFMHLRYDSPLNAMWFIFALFFVALFIGGTMGDTRQYQGDLIPGYAPAMNP